MKKSILAITLLYGSSAALHAESTVSGYLCGDALPSQQYVIIGEGPDAISPTGGICFRKRNVSGTVRTDKVSNRNVAAGRGSGAAAQAGVFRATNSNVSGFLSDSSVVEQTIPLVASGTVEAAGGVSMENTNFSWMASPNTVVCRAILTDGPPDTQVAIGGIHAK